MGCCMCLLPPDGWIWCENLNALWVSVCGAFVCCLWVVGLAVCVYCGVMYVWDFRWGAKSPFCLFICKIFFFLGGGGQADVWVFPYRKPHYSQVRHSWDLQISNMWNLFIFCPCYCIFYYLFIFFFVLFYVHLSSLWHCVTFILFSLINCCL